MSYENQNPFAAFWNVCQNALTYEMSNLSIVCQTY